MSDFKDLPSPSSPNFQARVREMLHQMLGRTGNPLDALLTRRDLVETGVLETVPGTGGKVLTPGPAVGGGPSEYVLDRTPPPMPEGFTASSGFSNILVECGPLIYQQGHGHGRSVLYGVKYVSGPLPTFADAVPLTDFQGQVFAYPSEPATTWRLWLTWNSNDGVESAPAGGTNGLAVTTGQDASYAVRALTGPGKPFTVLYEPTVIGGVTFPPAIYSTNAFLIDAQVTNAKIANAAIDDAKVANLSAAKLTVGDGTVGGILKSANLVLGSSGWVIRPDGYAEFNGVVVRGTVYAWAGQIGGITIAAGSLSTAPWATAGGYYLGANGSLSLGNKLIWDGYSLKISGEINVGAYSGYGWPSSGGGAHLSAAGLLLGNPNTGGYFQVTGDGDVNAPNFSIHGNTVTARGNLSANILTTNGGRFSAYSDGSVVADRVDIRRRDAIATGTASANGSAFAQTFDGSSYYWEMDKQLVVVTIDTGVDSWDAVDFGINQPLHAIVRPDSSYWTGNSRPPGAYIARFSVSAKPVLSSTHYNTGGQPNAVAPRIYIRAEIRLDDVAANINKIEMWGLSWSLFKS